MNLKVPNIQIIKGTKIMADNCGDSCGNQNFDGMTQTYKRILWIIVAINGVDVLC